MSQTTPLDLRPSDADLWPRVEVPGGWEPIGEICRSVYDDRASVADRIVDSIQLEIPAYRVATVPRADLLASVLGNMDMMFVGLAENRSPTAAELDVRRELGHRRAAQGLPIDALLQAYHVGYRELWRELVARARNSSESAAVELLPDAATTFWGWIQRVTDAVAEAYDETARARDALAIGSRQRLVELLISGDLDSDELIELSQAQGFSSDGVYRVLYIRPGALSGGEPLLVQKSLSQLEGTHMCMTRGSALLVLSRDGNAEAIEQAMSGLFPDAPVGAGVARPGLGGARLSIIDAERALMVAERSGGLQRFEDCWLQALVIRGEDQLRPTLLVGIDVAKKDQHLAEAVTAFAESGFSVAATARTLMIHANSVTYRLERWHRLTGWDPRTFSGLAKSMAALELID